MDCTIIHDYASIEAYLRRHAAASVYQLGDLDEFFRPHTDWYTLPGDGDLTCLALVYRAFGTPTVLAFAYDAPEREALRALLAAMGSVLPVEFYIHASPGLVDGIPGFAVRRVMGSFHKMALPPNAYLPEIPQVPVTVLETGHLTALHDLYRAAYPGNWFDARMIATGTYRGVFEGETLIAAAGTQVYSSAYRVAALGNVAVSPAHRNRGLGAALTRALCRDLRPFADTIALNAGTENPAAVRCYKKIGFTIVDRFDWLLAGKDIPDKKNQPWAPSCHNTGTDSFLVSFASFSPRVTSVPAFLPAVTPYIKSYTGWACVILSDRASFRMG